MTQLTVGLTQKEDEMYELGWHLLWRGSLVNRKAHAKTGDTAFLWIEKICPQLLPN